MGESKLPHSLIEEVVARLDIVDVISEYIPLEPSGRNFKALCPFHAEKTPSFIVSPEKQIFKCFGCGVGGNVISFIEKYENISFREALAKAARKAGIDALEFSKDDKFARFKEAGLSIARFFHSNVDGVWTYLEGRGITRDMVDKFLVGFAPTGYLSKMSFGDDVLKMLGVVSSNGREFFAGRLVIPIFNHSGDVVAFGARAVKIGQEPKYINSPESDIFRKRSLLFGFYQSKEHILRSREAVVVEGYFDVISMYGGGFCNVVAPMGTSVTEEQASTLKRYADRVILMFDGDNAGRKAMLRAGRIFCGVGVEPFVVSLPEGEDPDSMVRRFPDDLKNMLNAPLPFSKWLVNFVKTSDELERISVLRDAVDAFRPIKDHDPFKFSSFASLLSAEFGVDAGWIDKISTSRKAARGDIEDQVIPRYEKAFLRGIIDGVIPDFVDISVNNFVSEKCSRLYSLMKLHKDRSLNLIGAEYPELSDVIAEICVDDFASEEIRAAFFRMLHKEFISRVRRIGKDSEADRRRLRKLAIEVSRGRYSSIEEFVRYLGDKTF